jgi:hypothetical protein
MPARDYTPNVVTMSEKSVVSRLIKAIETPEGSPLSLDDVGLLMLSVGRTNGPFIVSQLFESGLLREEDLPALVTAAWSMAEFPMRMIPRLEWIRMWDSAGYSVDGRPAQRPIGSRTLYRGAPRSRRFGFAWTSDLQQATSDLRTATSTSTFLTAECGWQRSDLRACGRKSLKDGTSTSSSSTPAGWQSPHMSSPKA